MPHSEAHTDGAGPWRPGLSSSIPGHLMPRVTLFDPRFSFVSWQEARDLAEATGLDPYELAVTRPERLALHSVLIRVTSQLYVPDGPSYAALGLNLRRMAGQIYDGFVAPQMPEITAAYEAVRAEAAGLIDTILAREIFPPPPPPPAPSLFERLTGRTPKAPAGPSPSERALKLATRWRDARNEDIPSACRRAVARTLGAVLNARGRLVLEADVLAKVALGLVMNRMGSAAIGRVVEGCFDAGAAHFGFRRLPPQSEPLVLNAKGASASGKSTIRAAQRAIAERLGYDWRDFAIISPDYWRKALMDYDSLGEDRKYGAMLCGKELEAIDRKLDILMTVKGAAGTVPHMLIDRFRFDSFSRDRVHAEDSTLLTRFGTRVFMFFMITPPAATVERAWLRGLETGRFKAVDDLLFHNIEAYTGMPDLFFGWAVNRSKDVHYEFLDNAVPKGAPPRCVAHGANGSLVIRDLERLCDIDRFREVNTEARAPGEVFTHEVTGRAALSFVRRALSELDRVEILVPGSDQVFARAEAGALLVETALVPPGLDPQHLGPFRPAIAPLGSLSAQSDPHIIGA